MGLTQLKHQKKNYQEKSQNESQNDSALNIQIHRPRSFFSSFFLIIIGFYRSLGSAWLGGACRFEPSCSQYAAEAFEKLPTFKATKLVLIRLLRCRPFGGMGYDPVPCCAHFVKTQEGNA